MQPDGSLGGTEAWGTAAEWATVTVTGLDMATDYDFDVQARNEDLVETAWGTSGGAATLAEPVTATLQAVSTTAVGVTVANGDNGPAAEYALRDVGSGNFVQLDGSLDSTEDWATAATWTGHTMRGSGPDQQVELDVKARNPDGIEAGYGASATRYTLAAVPPVPGVSGPTTTSLDVTVNRGANPTTTQVALYEAGTGLYVQADGTLAAGPAWDDVSATAWDTATVTGLTQGSSYSFQVKARNGDEVETGFGDSAGMATLPEDDGDDGDDPSDPADPGDPTDPGDPSDPADPSSPGDAGDGTGGGGSGLVGELPFTGMELAVLVAAGLFLLAAGAVLTQSSGRTATSSTDSSRRGPS